MKYLFIIFLFAIIPLQSQVKVKKYDVKELVFTQTKYDTLIITKINFIAKLSSDVEYIPAVPDTIFKKGTKIFSDSTMDFNKVFKQAEITYIDPKTFEEKVQKLKLNIKSKYINPFEESMRCQATTQKGSQCSRSTTDKSGCCWQHK